MAYINGNGTSYNMASLSNFLKSTFGTKWDRVLEKGLFITPNKSIKYDLLKSKSPKGVFLDFNAKNTIKDIENQLQKITNSY